VANHSLCFAYSQNMSRQGGPKSSVLLTPSP
jgi:hypothetical protein